MADRPLLGRQATLAARLAGGADVDHASRLLKNRQALIGYSRADNWPVGSPIADKHLFLQFLNLAFIFVINY